MEWVERTDRTVEAAKDFLLDQLGVDEEEAEFEVLEEPKPGLFGRVRGQARVRARVTPRAPRAKEERRRRTGRGRDAQGGGNGGGNGNGGRQPAARGGQGRGSQERGSQDRGGQGASQSTPKPERAPEPAERREQRVASSPATEVDPAPFVEPVRAFLAELVDAFGLTAAVEIDVTDERELEVRIEGDGLGPLIGPAGGVINAVQELSRTYLQKLAQGGTAPRLKVDVGGYRADRRTALAAYAQEVARTVVETGRPHAFEPMGSVDRKIVHDAASEVPGVVTRSDGEDPARRVVIAAA
jgi:spoIIIJ-associated protein